MIVFLYRNGVNPAIIKDFFSECYRFDGSAWRQINYVIKALEQGRNWEQWNVVMQRSM